MLKQEIEKYRLLNKFADPNGTVIFGGASDKEIPLGELKQAFAPNEKLYNRSFENLCADNAEQTYKACVADLHPETVLIHIGERDIEISGEDEDGFTKKYCALIGCIKSDSHNCRVGVVSLKNPENDPTVARFNERLKGIADAQKCEYIDIAAPCKAGEVGAESVAAFLHSVGFVRPLTSLRPVHDIAKIVYQCVIRNA